MQCLRAVPLWQTTSSWLGTVSRGCHTQWWLERSIRNKEGMWQGKMNDKVTEREEVKSLAVIQRCVCVWRGACGVWEGVQAIRPIVRSGGSPHVV